MKNINIMLSDQEYSYLMARKGKKTWKDFIMSTKEGVKDGDVRDVKEFEDKRE